MPGAAQVLLSQVHRLRALVLLGRFLDMGGWAVDLALSVGIFPYVLKLLQTTAADLRTTLVFIWAKILALDASCQARRPAALPPTPAPRRARRSDWDRLTCAACALSISRTLLELEVGEVCIPVLCMLCCVSKLHDGHLRSAAAALLSPPSARLTAGMPCRLRRRTW